MTGVYNEENYKDILKSFGILLDGKYRENVMPAGIYELIEKYVRTPGNAGDGLYCYNFCLNTDPFDFQPNGAMNLSKFNNVELELQTNPHQKEQLQLQLLALVLRHKQLRLRRTMHHQYYQFQQIL